MKCEVKDCTNNLGDDYLLLIRTIPKETKVVCYCGDHARGLSKYYTDLQRDDGQG